MTYTHTVIPGNQAHRPFNSLYLPEGLHVIRFLYLLGVVNLIGELQPVNKKKLTSTGSARRKSYTAPALSKGLDILELMTTETEGLSLGQVADKLSRSKGEIFRMLTILEDRNYIYRMRESDTYILTMKIFELAHRHSYVKRLSSAVEPVMRKLVRSIEQSCHLIIYFNGRGVVIAQQDSPGERGLNVRLGATAALPNTCSGHVLLAFAEPDRRREMLAEQAPRYKKLLTATAADRMAERVRQQGFEQIESGQVQGVIDIGYPVFDYSGKSIAALVVPFLEYLDGSHRVSFEEAGKHLEAAAVTISIVLGYQS